MSAPQDHPVDILRSDLLESLGGPHDDEAFMAGWRMGTIASALRIAKLQDAQPGDTPLQAMVRCEELHTSDMLAMLYGYVCTQHPVLLPLLGPFGHEWHSVAFHRVSDDLTLPPSP